MYCFAIMLTASIFMAQDAERSDAACPQIYKGKTEIRAASIICEYKLDEENISDIMGFEIVLKVGNISCSKMEWRNGSKVENPLSILKVDTLSGLCYVAVVKKGAGPSTAKGANLGALFIETPAGIAASIEIVRYETVDNDHRITRHRIMQLTPELTGENIESGGESDNIKTDEIVSISPNPFNAAAIIHYTVTERSLVSIRVYDIQGRRVATLLSERKDRGGYRIIWNGKNDANLDVASGVYFVRMQVNRKVQSHKVLILR